MFNRLSLLHVILCTIRISPKVDILPEAVSRAITIDIIENERTIFFFNLAIFRAAVADVDLVFKKKCTNSFLCKCRDCKIYPLIDVQD